MMENIFATKVYRKIKPVLEQINELSGQLNCGQSLKKPKELTLSIQDNTYKFLQIIEDAIANFYLSQTFIKKKTDKSSNDFIDFLSHEIRNSLNSIIGFIQIIESTKISSGQKSVYTYIVLNGVGKLKRVVDSIKEYTELVSDLKISND